MKASSYLATAFIAVMTSYSACSKEENDNTITITTSRFNQKFSEVPSYVSVITSQDIEKINPNNIAQLLRKVAGVQISQLSGKNIISLRGVSAEQAANNVLIQVDGRRLNNTDIASPDLESIDIDSIERIEVIQGTGSSLYGDQAVAGIINIITKSVDGIRENEIKVRAGSFNSQGVYINTHQQLDEEWALGLMASDYRTDNYRQHNEQHLQNVSLKVNYTTEQADWRLEVFSHKEELQTPGALLATELSEPTFSRPEFSRDFVNTDHKSYRLFGQQQLDELWSFALDIHSTDFKGESINSFIGFATTTINQTDRSQLSIYPRLKYAWTTEGLASEWILGVDYDDNQYSFSLLNRDNQQTITSLYSQLNVVINDDWQIQLAGRLSEVEDRLTDGFLYPQGVNIDNSANAIDMGTHYQITNHLNLFARISKSFRFAKVDEQAYTSENFVGLEPQTGRSYEVGVDYVNDNHHIKFSIYHLELNDEIIFDPSVPSPPGAFFPGANVNAGSSKREGVLADYSVSVSEFVELGINAHYIDSSLNYGQQKTTIPGVAQYNINSWINWGLAENWNLFLETHYLSKRFQEGDFTNTQDKLSGYALVNGSLSWQAEALKVSLRVDNLFDKEYISYAQFGGFYPGTGRATELSVSYKF